MKIYFPFRILDLSCWTVLSYLRRRIRSFTTAHLSPFSPFGACTFARARVCSRVHCHPIMTAEICLKVASVSHGTFSTRDNIVGQLGGSLMPSVLSDPKIYRDGERAERGSIPRKMPAYDKRTATFLPLRAALLSPAFVNKGDVNESERERE